MNAEAITEARIRLRRAENAVRELQRLDFDFDRQEDAWWTFLLAADQVYQKLLSGSRNDPRARQWFGGKERERSDDPLLKYVHQARNADQHGLSPSTKRTKMTLVAVHGCEVICDGGGNVLELKATVGVPMEARAVPPEIKLIPVRNRGVEFDPPGEHLGQPLIDGSPAEVATAAICHLRRLIEDAAAYVH
jgi:hypothetical protein